MLFLLAIELCVTLWGLGYFLCLTIATRQITSLSIHTLLLVRLLQTAQGSLLDDEQLVNTLNSSKTTSQEVAEQLQVSEQTEIKIDAAREVLILFTLRYKRIFLYSPNLSFLHMIPFWTQTGLLFLCRATVRARSEPQFSSSFWMTWER